MNFAKDSHKSQYKQVLASNYATGVIGAILLAALVAAYLFVDYNNTRIQNIEGLRRLSMTATSRTQSLISNIHITLKLLDEWIQCNPDRDPRFDPEFNRLVDVFREQMNHDVDLRMVTEEGKLFYLPSKSMQPLADVSDREYYRAQKDTAGQGIYFANPVISRVTKNWGIPISYKLRKNKHGLLVLFASVEFRILDRIFADIVVNPYCSVTVVREDGLVLERTPFNEYLVGKKYGSPLNAPGYDIVTINIPEKTRRIIFFHKLENLPVYVVVANGYDRWQQDWLYSAAIKAGVGLIICTVFLLLNLRAIRLLRKVNEISVQLVVAARYDSLTELKNRRYFFERVAEEFERAKRYGSSMTLLVIDVDHFKELNDTCGHPEGDSILKQLAIVFNACVRTTDIVGRVGGDEFAILLTNTNLDCAIEVAERIRKGAESLCSHNWKCGVSIGIADWKGSAEAIDSMNKRADMALYRAKDSGRNSIATDE